MQQFLVEYDRQDLGSTDGVPYIRFLQLPACSVLPFDRADEPRSSDTHLPEYWCNGGVLIVCIDRLAAGAPED